MKVMKDKFNAAFELNYSGEGFLALKEGKSCQNLQHQIIKQLPISDKKKNLKIFDSKLNLLFRLIIAILLIKRNIDKTCSLVAFVHR